MATIKEINDDSKAKLDALLTYANGVTGQEDVSIGDAVKTLCDGFGQDASSGIETEYTAQSTSNFMTVPHDLGHAPMLALAINLTKTESEVMDDDTGVCYAFVVNRDGVIVSAAKGKNKANRQLGWSFGVTPLITASSVGFTTVSGNVQFVKDTRYKVFFI